MYFFILIFISFYNLQCSHSWPLVNYLNIFQISWFVYSIFSIVYGKIAGTLETSEDNRIEVKTVNLENGLKYNIYKIDNGKLYTNRVHDTAAILDSKIINGPSR